MKYKLLVAEDVPAERIALVSILQKRLGSMVNILEAGNGRDALMLYEQEKPDILVLNIEMPFLSGLEVAQKVREQDKLCAILFISDFDNFSYAKQAILLRAMDYILKPYEESKLISSIEEAIEHIAHQSSILLKVQHTPDVHTVPPEDEPEGARIALVREDITAFIESHYMEELSMKNAASAMNYSDAYFCKLFKQCFHVNFSTYLSEFRIRKAQAMMENPRINIKEISLACGYADSNYFSRVFKRVTGQTPTEYRLSIMEKALWKQ